MGRRTRVYALYYLGIDDRGVAVYRERMHSALTMEHRARRLAILRRCPIAIVHEFSRRIIAFTRREGRKVVLEFPSEDRHIRSSTPDLAQLPSTAI